MLKINVRRDRVSYSKKKTALAALVVGGKEDLDKVDQALVDLDKVGLALVAEVRETVAEVREPVAEVRVDAVEVRVDAVEVRVE